MLTSKIISEKLKIALENSKLPKSELAKQLGIRENTLDNYLSGKSLPSVFIFANLCKILNLNPNEILCISIYKEN